MDARLVEFTEVLRQNGLRVSTSELADAARAVAEVGLADRALFASALRATLVKRDLDGPTFDRAFEFFFSGAASTLEALDASLAARIRERGLLEGDELTMVLAQLHQLAGGLSPLTQRALAGDRGGLAQLFRGATLQLDLTRFESPLQAGFFSRRLMVGVGADRMREDLKSIQAELQARGVSTAGLEVVSKHLGELLRDVERAARLEVERQGRARLRRQSGALPERAFSTFSPGELELAKSAVRRLAEKLKSRLVRKQLHRRRGTLNVRRTLRRNLAWGGVPMVPIFRTRRPQRPDVVILCDVSDSVRNVSRLMLLFMHTLQSLFARVRSFVFISEVAEVTRFLKEREVDDAIEEAFSGQALSRSGNSNYGRALASFVRDELPSLSRRTTVIVIGDGRNNYNAPNAWALKELRHKARRLLWICPEDASGWGLGDSEMPAYAVHCTQVVTVQSLKDLSQVAEALLPA